MNINQTSFDVPILINAFNRPETTKKVFDSVRKIRPKKLFLATDGPRINNQEDRDKSEQIKEIFQRVDWDCDVERLYRDKNLGCPRAIPEAIDWFFSKVDQGIILEDDCLPNNSFFQFCKILLDKYKYNDNVMMISGNNFIPEERFSDHSYFFSKYGFIWGWATWGRAWQKFDESMSSYPSFISSKEFIRRYPSLLDRFFWKTAFKNKYHGYSKGWAMKWNYSMAYNGGYGVIPSKNLVTNIGFGPDATITKKVDRRMIIDTSPVVFPLLHPEKIEANVLYDKRIFRRNFLSMVNPRTLLINYLNAHRRN